MKTVVLYTTNVGGHDPSWIGWSRQDLPGFHVEEVEVTERQILEWFDPPEGLHPVTRDRLVARWAKCHPHVLFPEADYSVWVDACLDVRSRHFLAEVLAQIGTGTLAMLPHPDRTSVAQEINAADTLAKYDGNRHREMVEVLAQKSGGPVDGLWAMTFIARRHSPSLRVMDRWIWAQTYRWTTPTAVALDQLILPFAAGFVGPRPISLLAPLDGDSDTGTLWRNDWFVRHPHERQS